jgi:hypothetical protein
MVFKKAPSPDESYLAPGGLPYAPAIAVGAILVLSGVRWLGA